MASSKKNDGLNPKDVTRGYAKKAWWLCSEGRKWQAEINSRQRCFPDTPTNIQHSSLPS